MDESTFERCLHDRENPYVQISRAMLQDKSISPKAKGVLAYLLSLPNDWKIYHSQLQKGLGVGEEYINSAINELISAGYMTRSREKIKGIFQPYKYRVSELKKFKPNRENQAGFPGPENPVLQKKEETSSLQKKQQQAAPDFAVASFDSKEKTTPKIYPCLESIDIPLRVKIQITAMDDEKTVIDAIGWATDPNNPPVKCLAASIRYACKHKLKYEPSKKKETPYETLCKQFKHGETYNGAECHLKTNVICFSRGTKNEEVLLDKYFKWEKIHQMCYSFGITFHGG